ncbi:MAG: hypothetical protein LC808_11095, partial [Actinobacteria bacterium]|nr:hypothetical protein [Actinomycetota bacterium]
MGTPNPLWVKSPLLLFRFKGLLIAVVTGALLLALASASFPLFVSATESSTLSEAIAGTTTYGAGVAVVQDGVNVVPTKTDERNGSVSFAERSRLLEERFQNVTGVGPQIRTILTPAVYATSPFAPGERPAVRLLSRTDGLSHVHKLQGDGNGVWIADTVASALHLHVGDNVDLGTATGSAKARVGGIYEALYKAPVPQGFWVNLVRETYTASAISGPPPPFVLMDKTELTRIATKADVDSVRFMWEFPLQERLTLPQAEALREEFDRFQHEFGDVRSDLGSKFFCTTCRNGTGDYFSLLPTAIGTARKNVTAVRGPVNLLSVAGIIVALTVIASAAVFTMARRRTESALLFARGTSALVVGAKAALESIVPVVFGTALGFGVAYGVFSFFGPPGSIDPTGVTSAEKVAALGIPVAVLLLGIVSAISYLRQSESATATFRKLSRLPWEIVVLAIASLFWRKVTAGGALVEGGGNSVARPSVYLLLFPIFFIGGAAGVGARVLQAPLRRAVKRSRAMRPGPYLALHRLAGTKRLAILLVTASALSLGILVYAQTVVRSLTTTINA